MAKEAIFFLDFQVVFVKNSWLNYKVFFVLFDLQKVQQVEDLLKHDLSEAWKQVCDLRLVAGDRFPSDS